MLLGLSRIGNSNSKFLEVIASVGHGANVLSRNKECVELQRKFEGTRTETVSFGIVC